MIQPFLYTISVLYCAHLCIKCSLDISNFLEEISSLSHSIVSLYFFGLITEEVFLISPCYSSELYIQMDVSCLFSFAFHFPSFQEYTEELYKKDLHDPGNHHGVITHLEPDILECEVKWVLGSINTDKASGGDGFQLSYFKS